MQHHTVKPITSFAQCQDFVRGFCIGNPFSDPMLSNDEQLRHNLVSAIDKPDSHTVVGVFDGDRLTGLFSFLTLPDEKYLEMLAGLSSDAKAYDAVFAYLEKNFASYSADFVFNPNNHLLSRLLQQRGAAFETEQQKMLLTHPAPQVDTSGVELLTEPYIPSYLDMHATDVYWTGEKVIAAADRFRSFVAIENGQVVGYLDVTCCFAENEPYDLLVKEDHRRKGFGRKLLAAALEMNKPNGMMVLVDIDNHAAIRLYESSGFEKVENQNSVTAHLVI